MKTNLPAAEDHVGLALSLARRYAGRGEDSDDLDQVALIGLIKARKRFRPELGHSFTTFATATILGELKRHFRDRRWSVHTTRGQQERFLATRDALDQLTQDLGRSPTVPEVAAATGLTEEQVLETQELAATFNPVRLDGPLEPADPETVQHVHQTLACIDDGFDAIERRVVIDRLLDRLPARERQILELRFVAELSQSEIARTIGVSQMHVSRLLRSTLNQLREWLEQ